MAIDFSVDEEFQEQLDWMKEFVAAEIERETHSGRKSPLPTVAVVPPLFERHFNLLLSIVIVGVHDDQNVLRSNVDADSVAL